MEKAKPRFRLVRGVAASAIVLLFLAGLIPNLMSFGELAVYIGILLVPLACIHFGADRFRFLEFIGWFLLLLLLVLEMSGCRTGQVRGINSEEVSGPESGLAGRFVSDSRICDRHDQGR